MSATEFKRIYAVLKGLGNRFKDKKKKKFAELRAPNPSSHFYRHYCLCIPSLDNKLERLYYGIPPPSSQNIHKR